MANKPDEANFFPDVPQFPSMGTFQPVYGKFDLTTYIQGASDYEIMAFLVGKYNACLEAYGNITKLSTDTITACKQLQDWINSWFTNLDVQHELNNKIDSMVKDGSFAQLMHQIFDAQINQNTTNAVTNWLVNNVTPTGSAVIVDKSLSIEGAAADAKITGSLIGVATYSSSWNPNSVITKAEALPGYFGYSSIIPANSQINTITISARTPRTYTLYFTDLDFNILHTVQINATAGRNNYAIDYINSEPAYLVIYNPTNLGFSYSSTGGLGNFIELDKTGEKFSPKFSLPEYAADVEVHYLRNATLNSLNFIANNLYRTKITWNPNSVITKAEALPGYFGYSSIIPANSQINTITISARTPRTYTLYFTDLDFNILHTVQINATAGRNNYAIDYINSEPAYLVIYNPTNLGFSYSSTGGLGNFIELDKTGEKFSPKFSLPEYAADVAIEGFFVKSEQSSKNYIIATPFTIKDDIKTAISIKNTTNIYPTLILTPGTYKFIDLKFVDGFSLIGTDRNTCIIRDDSGEYNRAPLRISGNAYVANLTLIATHDKANNYITNGNLNTNPSYALHIDDRHPDDNKKYRCTVENCVLISKQNPAVGIGLDKNQIIELINCECVREQTDDMFTVTSVSSNVFAWKPDGGAVFYHALYPHYTSDEGYQTLRVKNCIITNNANNVIGGEPGSSLDDKVVLEFIGNSGVAANGLAWNKGLTKATISKLSYGNNIQSMNYTE